MKVLALLITIHAVFGVETFKHNFRPGLRLIINKLGFDRLGPLFAKEVTNVLPGMHLPDVEGSSSMGHLFTITEQYRLSDIYVQEASASQKTTYVKTDNNQLLMKIDQLTLGMQNANYWVKLGFLEKSGHVSASLKEGALEASLSIKTRGDGRAEFKMNACKAQLDNVKLTFEGSIIDSALNLIEKLALPALRSTLQEELCKILEDQMKAILDSIPLPVELKPGFWLDYAFQGDPVMTDGRLQADSKAKLFFADAKEEPKTHPKMPSPALDTDKHMFHLMVTNYMLGSLMDAVEDSDIIKMTLDKPTIEKLQPGQGALLNTTCKSPAVCVGALMPPLAEQYPSSDVIILTSKDQQPEATLTKDKMLMTASIRMDMRVHNKTSGLYQPAINCSITLPIAFQKPRLEFVNGTKSYLLKGGLHPEAIQTKAIDNEVDGLTDAKLEGAFRTLIFGATFNTLMKLGNEGIAIPALPAGLLLKDVAIGVEQDYMALSLSVDA